MDTWGVVFLGVIAFCSLVQAGFLIGLARGGRRLARRFDELQARLERDVRPGLENLTRISRNVAEVSDMAVLQARRIDGLIADTVEKIEETTAQLRRVIVRPLGPLMDIAAFFRGLRRGFQVYRQVRGLESQEKGAGRRYAEDEHLFI